GERASRHTATFEALQSVIRLTVVSEGIRRGRADLGAEEHAAQGEQHGESAAGGEPTGPGRPARPRGSPARGRRATGAGTSSAAQRLTGGWLGPRGGSSASRCDLRNQRRLLPPGPRL